jgi:uncharacterized membrane protein YcjF (UPF0283 family)
MSSDPEQTPLGSIVPGETRPILEQDNNVETPTTEPGHRGSDELGIPVASTNLVTAPSTPPEDSSEDAAPEFHADGPRIKLGSTTAGMAVMALLAGFIIFVYSQVLSILAELAALSYPWQIVGHIVLWSLITVIAIFLLRLAWLWVRLKASPQVSLRRLQALSEKRSLRGMSALETQQARQDLRGYLREYPFEKEKTVKLLQNFGLTDDDVEKLRRYKQHLLDTSVGHGHKEWIGLFDQHILSNLDRAAVKLSRRHALRVTVKTAAARSSLVDGAIVLYSSFAMIGDLARLYRLRTGPLGTAYLLVRAFIHAYLARHIEDSFEELSNSLVEEAPSIVTKIGTKIVGKLAEGAVNGVFIYRLGCATRDLIRPIRA